MAEVPLLHNMLLVGGVVFAIGLVGFLSRRNLIIMFLAAEMMLQGIAVSLVAWSRYHNDWGGQMLVVFIITVAACEAAIALALILVLYHQSGNLDIAWWHGMRESNQPAYVDQELPALDEQPEVWPTLTPAGIEPEHRPEETKFRAHV